VPDDYQAIFAKLDPQMDNAMATNDTRALEALLAPDFLYTHSNGKTQDKAEFIAAIGARPNPPARVLTDVQAEVHGDVAVTRGNLDVVYRDLAPTKMFRYVRVYRREGERWVPFSHRTLYALDRHL
jgi:ketosteroid isomerase-like protein